MESKNEIPATEQERGNRRKMVGVVTSDKMDKTVVVMVTRRVRDAKFGKFVTKRATRWLSSSRGPFPKRSAGEWLS